MKGDNQKMEDNREERLPVVDREGRVIGSATRGECHRGNGGAGGALGTGGAEKLLHPVVHLHVYNSRGELYLQKRPEWKEIQPGKWDTAVGGHVDYGESIEEALLREVREELGITEFEPEFLLRYEFESERERELVHVYRTVYDGPVTPSAELAGGRFWTPTELVAAMGQGILTPNFEQEYGRIE